MPVFDTPASINVIIDLSVGSVRIAAGDRVDTVVDVRPSDPGDQSDVEAASQVRVEHTDGTLRITGPKRTFDFSRKSKSVDVTVELPTGSQVGAELQLGGVDCTGLLGPCRIKTAAGHIRVEQTGPLHLTTAAGDVTVGGATGDAEISTGSGRTRIGELGGTGSIKSSNGDIVIDRATGDVRARTANGDIRIDRAAADVDAKTSSGAVRVGEVARGTVTLGTSMGDLEIGIAAGTAAWLEVDTSFGKVRNELTNAPSPAEADETVKVRGRTSFGDIRIHRSR